MGFFNLRRLQLRVSRCRCKYANGCWKLSDFSCQWWGLDVGLAVSDYLMQPMDTKYILIQGSNKLGPLAVGAEYFPQVPKDAAPLFR